MTMFVIKNRRTPEEIKELTEEIYKKQKEYELFRTRLYKDFNYYEEESMYLFSDWNLEAIFNEYNKLDDEWIKNQVKEFKSGKKLKDIKICHRLSYDLTKKSYIRKNTKLMNINKNCTQWLGICIAENLLPEIFENVEMMPYGNPGFDALCNKGFKLDVKKFKAASDFDMQ